MKRISFIFVLLIYVFSSVYSQESKNNINFAAEEESRKKSENKYQFSVGYRIEAGYVQDWQHSRSLSYPDLYLHGARVGGMVSFALPYWLSLEVGLRYSLTTGITEQHIRATQLDVTQAQWLKHNVMEHRLAVPLLINYDLQLWRLLSMHFFTGPQFELGLAQTDNIVSQLDPTTVAWMQKNGMHTESYERYSAGELNRFCFSWTIGGGFQWDKYRLSAGYDFGLNNLARNTEQHMWQWSWFVSFSYRF